MAGRKRRGWTKYIADYDKLRMFLRYISYGCYHKQYLARQLGQSARCYEDNWARVRSFLPEDRLQAVRQGHREVHSLKGDSYHSSFNDLARTYAIKSLKSSSAFALLCLLQVFLQRFFCFVQASICHLPDEIQNRFDHFFFCPGVSQHLHLLMQPTVWFRQALNRRIDPVDQFPEPVLVPVSAVAVQKMEERRITFFEIFFQEPVHCLRFQKRLLGVITDFKVRLHLRHVKISSDDFQGKGMKRTDLCLRQQIHLCRMKADGRQSRTGSSYQRQWR